MSDNRSEHFTVVVADDDARVRIALRTILETAPDLRVVAEAADGLAAVENCRAHCPDVVLLDIRMPVLDGLSAAEHLLQEEHPPAVVMVTTFGDNAYVDTAVELGVAGFLLKSGDPHTLVAGVRAAARGGSCLSPEVARHVLADLRAARTAPRSAPAPDLSCLTERQRELLHLLARGRTNAEIAAELHLSEGTVKGYVRDIFARLGVRNRVEAALLAHVRQCPRAEAHRPSTARPTHLR